MEQLSWMKKHLLKTFALQYRKMISHNRRFKSSQPCKTLCGTSQMDYCDVKKKSMSPTRKNLDSESCKTSMITSWLVITDAIRPFNWFDGNTCGLTYANSLKNFVK